MRVVVQHRSRYHYPRPALLGPQLIRLRPADHTRARIESYQLLVEPVDLAVFKDCGQRQPIPAEVFNVAAANRTWFDRRCVVGSRRVDYQLTTPGLNLQLRPPGVARAWWQTRRLHSV